MANDDTMIQDGDSSIKPLAEDNDTPFSPPTDLENNPSPNSNQPFDRLDPTHQRIDDATDIDSQQLYDEGLAGAAEASEPNANNAVTGYDPMHDQRNQVQTNNPNLSNSTPDQIP